MVLMKDKTKVLNRNALYKEVWLTPMVRLATKYGISDVGLKKICKKLNIPTPPLGYWAKVQYDIRVKKAPLPKLKAGQPTTYTLRTYGTRSSQKAEKGHNFSVEAEQLIAQLSSKPFKVPAKLMSPHPLLAQTRDAFAKADTNKYGMLIGDWRKSHLEMRVSPAMFKRALRIFNAIIKFFEKEGFIVSTEKNDYGRKTHIKIFGEDINFLIREPSRQHYHKLTAKEEQELKRWPSAFIEKYDYIPSGILILEIDRYSCAGLRKKWTDGKGKLVEDYLIDFTVNLIKVADINRSERIQREKDRKRLQEEQQHFEELERLRELEEQRLRELENQANLWNQSERLRAYIQAVEEESKGREYSEESKAKLIKWTKWAKAHADRLDPLSKGLPFEYD